MSLPSLSPWVKSLTMALPMGGWGIATTNWDVGSYVYFLLPPEKYRVGRKGIALALAGVVPNVIMESYALAVIELLVSKEAVVDVRI